MKEFTIRLETIKEQREVENLTREAFWNVYIPGCKEHYVLNQYRSNPDFIPELNFVMEVEGRIIGHVMYSKAEIVKEDGSVQTSLPNLIASLYQYSRQCCYKIRLSENWLYLCTVKIIQPKP